MRSLTRYQFNKLVHIMLVLLIFYKLQIYYFFGKK